MTGAFTTTVVVDKIAVEVVVYVTSRRGRPAARPLHLDQDGARVLAGLLQDAALAVIDGTELAAELERAADQLAWS